jgi:hypothetical protein
LDYYQTQPEDEQGAPREPYAQQPNAFQQPLSNAPASEAPVTVVFKNGRPPERIHNYLLTPTMLMVLDQHRQDIPVDQIDLNATARLNLEAGVEFSLPSRSQ